MLCATVERYRRVLACRSQRFVPNRRIVRPGRAMPFLVVTREKLVEGQPRIGRLNRAYPVKTDTPYMLGCRARTISCSCGPEGDVGRAAN